MSGTPTPRCGGSKLSYSEVSHNGKFLGRLFPEVLVSLHSRPRTRHCPPHCCCFCSRLKPVRIMLVENTFSLCFSLAIYIRALSLISEKGIPMADSCDSDSATRLVLQSIQNWLKVKAAMPKLPDAQPKRIIQSLSVKITPSARTSNLYAIFPSSCHHGRSASSSTRVDVGIERLGNLSAYGCKPFPVNLLCNGICITHICETVEEFHSEAYAALYYQYHLPPASPKRQPTIWYPKLPSIVNHRTQKQH